MNTRTTGLLFAGGTALCWGVLAILLKNALEFADPKTIVAFRMIFAVSILLPVLLIQNKGSFSIFRFPPLLLFLGALGLAFNYLGFMNGVAYTGASNAQIMIQTGPVLLLFSGFLIYKEKTNIKQVLWLLTAFMGFALFYWEQMSFQNGPRLLTGNAWIVSAALTWVFYSLVMKKLSGSSNPQVLNFFVFILCSFVLGIGIDFKLLQSLSLFQWAFLFVLGLNTVLAYGFFAEALKRAPASQVSVIITLNPILTLLIIGLGRDLTPVIPNEPQSLSSYAGAGLVVMGTIFSILTSPEKGQEA